MKSTYHITFLVFILCSCGGGGGGGSAESPSITQPAINISYSSLPNTIYSYQRLNIDVSSNYSECKYILSGEDIHWIENSGNSFNFNAPITVLEEEEFKFQLNSISTSTCPAGSKEVSLNIKKNNTKYNPIPINNLDQKTNYYNNLDIGFGGIEISDRYSATICYPTPEDCTTYNNELFGQDAHNMATGDFNGDGHEDLAVGWAIFPHTIEDEKKLYAPIHIYLNDGEGHLYEDKTIFASSEYFVHPFAYRLAIEDFNADGLDDIFAGSMGKQVRGEDQSQNYIAPFPHLLLLSNQNGFFEDKSSNIEDQNNGEGPLCGFAHDASSGDFDNDGDMDIFACNMILVNNGLGEFSIHPFIGIDWYYSHMSPMSSLLTDLNNDGYDDIVFWNFDNRFLFENQPEEGTILLSNNSADVANWQELELPKGPFAINRNKYNHAASGDLNQDGFNDVVVSITRDDPYYEGAYIQILINDQTGNLIDSTSAHFPNQSRLDNHHGEGNIYLRDIDGDGDLDIFHSTRDFQSNFSGAHIAINDGQGNFSSNESILPERPVSFSNSTRSLMKGVPINLDNKGCIDLVSTSDSWTDANTTTNYLFSIINVDCSF
jgi:hypothetical protein